MVRFIPPSPVAPPAGPVAADAPAQAPEPEPLTPGQLAIPVRGVASAQIVDTWGQSRANGQRAHEGTDIMAPAGTPVIAAAPGTVEKLFFSHGGGGITLYVRSPDRLWSYYYAHLQGYAPGIAEGQAVKPGDLLGFVGDTGNAGAGNFHLHFGVARMQPNERWWQGQAVNPYPMLVGAR
ncbi:MAG: M23 family metallopeptidase [Sphingomonas sp.]|uniref:M23 family metallopeptidase n=1 Tax=Sphingomonas sp. TaxID=28214 RepID=UPI001B11CFDE|nr:M23 family metallopeptidase [Sphingomonas sp.]MBO9623067.1 M23 family metallopeptidase [Sphingomonas sp.]